MARSVRGGSRLDSGLLIACVVLSVLALVIKGDVRDRVSATLRTTVLAPLVALEGRSAAIRATVTSRSDVLNTRGELAVRALSVQALTDENDALRRMVGLGARLRDGFVVAELLPTRGTNDDFTIALNVGTNVGVMPYSPVVSADGLVGMVRTVDANTSYAITWASPEFAVSAMSADETAFGIVKPHLGTGADRWLLELRSVPYRANVDSGTLVVSAGMGGTYPRGIPIGTVLSEISTTEKWARTYLLRPAVLPKSLGPLIVMLPPRAARGVNGVWTTVTSADSAARAVATAGDSLARNAALDELAARRAAQDSTGVDSLARDTIVRRPVTRADSARADSARPARTARPDTARPRPTGPPPVSLLRDGPPPPDESR
ncbi:MAG TPA: rod shape-determining protein MreC [Gemmatimonas sp.]|nr:rod shape-determining protein MreC [Gemmatimonas sp.]